MGGRGGAGVTEPDRTDTEFNQLYGYAPAVGPQPMRFLIRAGIGLKPLIIFT